MYDILISDQLKCMTILLKELEQKPLKVRKPEDGNWPVSWEKGP